MELCINCMNGTLVDGRCNHCHQSEQPAKDRLYYALPARSTLHKQYYLGRVLGAGGYGITYLAWDLKNNRRVVVKELYPRENVIRLNDRFSIKSKPGSEKYFSHVKESFRHEAQTLYGLSEFPEVIDVYHLFEDNGTVYYVMEYLEGTDLSKLLKNNGRMSWEQLSPLIKMVFRALNTLHKKGLIHRDISPDNIFVTSDGQAKLIDFGSVRNYENGNEMSTILKHRFAPFEQYQTRGNQGPWTDVYALSVTIYYALSGKLPQSAPDRIMHDNTRPLSELNPSVPQYVSKSIQKGMSCAIEDRYATVSLFAGDLFPGEPPLDNIGRVRSYNHQSPSGPDPSVSSNATYLIFTQGIRQGTRLNLIKGKEITIGRSKECSFSYSEYSPKQVPGVSRHQCTIVLDNRGVIFIRDDGSSYGTYVNRTPLVPNQWTRIHRGSSITYGHEEIHIQ